MNYELSLYVAGRVLKGMKWDEIMAFTFLYIMGGGGIHA